MNRNVNLNESGIFSSDCPICLKKLDNDKVYLNCNHYFHKECIMNWKKRNNTCPICRKRIEVIKEAFNIKKFFKMILSFIIRLIILIILMTLVIKVFKIFIIPLVVNIVKIPTNFLIKLLKNLFDIIILIIVIFTKICKNIVFGIFSQVNKLFGGVESVLDLINQFMNKIKNYLENINRKL